MLDKKYLMLYFLCAAIITFGIMLTPLYANYKLKTNISQLNPIIETLQQVFVTYAKLHGYFPDQKTLQLDSTKLYDITTWTSDRSNAITPIGQIAVIQAEINGKELGLTIGDGGMVTCLMALRNATIESKCFYQIKKM